MEKKKKKKTLLRRARSRVVMFLVATLFKLIT